MRSASTHRRSKRLAEEIANTAVERIIGNSAQLAIIGIGFVVLVVALHLGQVVLAPVFLAIVVGLMFGPVADLLERRGIPDPVSAGILLIGFLVVIAGSILAFAAPLSDWADKIPVIWSRVQAELANWREPLAAIGALQERIKGVFGGDAAMTVAVEDSAAVIDLALMAPAMLSQVVIFLLSLYFFLATRDQVRVAALSLCVTRRLRWRMAHVFRDVEEKVSRYLLTISMVNIGVGIVVTLITWGLGLPTPPLWGALAAVLNYVPFVGQAVMAFLLFLVGMSSSTDLAGALLPVVLYWIVNFVEGNFVTPNLLGRTMTINPFVIFLSLVFWLWTWGPVGGLVAVPSLLMLYSVALHILPIRDVTPRSVRRRVTRQAESDALDGAVEAAKARREAPPDAPVVAPPEPEPVGPAPSARRSAAATAR